VTPPRGAFVLFPTRHRPQRGARGHHRVGLRHGVSTVTRGAHRARDRLPRRPVSPLPSPEWTLLDASGRPYGSTTPETLGGHRRTHIYGRLDCPGAARAVARGGYVAGRVFFPDEPTARAAGYRPCAVCLPGRYAAWKEEQAARAVGQRSPTRPRAAMPAARPARKIARRASTAVDKRSSSM